MKRHLIDARPDWINKVERVGFTYHTQGQDPSDIAGCYWNEKICYEFTAAEVDKLEAATNELHKLCLKAVDHVVKNPQLMDRFQIPVPFREYIIRSWNRKDPNFYGRFDLAFDPTSPKLMEPKMLEYNADTPTLLIESAIVQWYWLMEKYPDADQFNSLHERMISRFVEFKNLMKKDSILYVSGMPNFNEEYMHCMYFMDLIYQAGINTKFVALDKLGWHEETKNFVDPENNQIIKYWMKLYPWEWLVQEEFGKNLLVDKMGIIEPVWKMLISNKAILPILWELFPNHPNLLPAYWSPEKLGSNYIKKPILSREGANIDLYKDNKLVEQTEGSYADKPMIYQEAVELPKFDGNYVVIGSWVIGDESAGMILREDTKPIVVNTSKVVPHFFR